MNSPRLKSEIAALKVMLAFRDLELLLLKANFDPNQPRDPAGSPTGGQWSGSGSSGARTTSRPGGSRAPARTARPRAETTVDRAEGVSEERAGRTLTTTDRTGEASWSKVTTTFDDLGGISEEVITNRDGSTIRSEYSFSDSQRAFDEAHTVTTSTGESIRFEQLGDTFSAYKGDTLISSSRWTPDGPEPLAESVFAPAIAYEAGVLLIPPALVYYNWLINRPRTAGSSDGSRPVISFRAREYLGSKGVELSYVGARSKEDVDRACPRYEEVQSRTSAAVMAIRAEERMRGAPYSPQTFGTKVHKHLETQIKALGDPNFVAEMSIDMRGDATYGTPGSIRTDVYNKVTNDLACVHDAKTGDAGLTEARYLAIANRVKQLFKTTTRIIIVEHRVPRK